MSNKLDYEMITIKQTTFDAMFEELKICDATGDLKLKDVNKNCYFCKGYDVCQIIGDDKNTRK